MSVKAERVTDVLIEPNPRRVLFRPFQPRDESRVMKIIARIMSLSKTEVKQELKQVMAEFEQRHPRVEQFLLRRFEDVRPYLILDKPLSKERQLLIGSYFTQEFSLESAALFNPSMIWHPDQSGVPEGSRRFIISLRATGEGHISSISFRTGIINSRKQINMDAPSPYVTTPEIHPNPTYDKGLFEQKLLEVDLLNDFSTRVLNGLDASFSLEALREGINYARRQSRTKNGNILSTARGMLALAESNYEVFFKPEDHISERIIFPTSQTELNGIEDARFVEFREEDGRVTYYATYTAYNGKFIFPQLLETPDFLDFRISTLNGEAVQNKGMALFPRKINGKYAMLARQDNENIYIMFSDHIQFWHETKLILKPTYPWEYVQLGNCGSPIETDAGWLVLSHGVGPMRKYSMGAFLLDKDDPTRVIGRLKEPLLTPNENEREGYVPNVVYSCGGQVFNNTLVIPYAMSDYASSFALVDLDELLTELTRGE